MAEKETDFSQEKGTFTVKSGMAQMLKGGVIMDVVSPEHAVIAETAGAVAVMALESARALMAWVSDGALMPRRSASWPWRMVPSSFSAARIGGPWTHFFTFWMASTSSLWSRTALVRWTTASR